MLKTRSSHAVAGAAFLIVSMHHASMAHAQGAEACNPAYEDADTLVRAGGDKLLDAREKLRVCARPACKPWMVKECTKSLSEVESRIPSVVFSARDAAGNELVEVKVTTGERSLTTRLDGRSVEIGPGERTFVFVAADGRRATVHAIVKEGEKAQSVSVILEPARAAPVVPPPAVQPAPAPAPPPTAAPEPSLPPKDAAPSGAGSGSSTLRTIGFVAGGAGILGLGLGAIFAIKAIGSKSDAQCNADNQCESGPLSDARSSASIATIGFVAGAALTAGGVALVLLSPARGSSSGRLEAVPGVAQNQAGVMFRGLW